MTTDLTTEILKQIPNGILELGPRQDQTNARFERVEHGLDDLNSRLGRVEHGLNDLGKLMRQIALDQAKHERFQTQHVERLDGDVSDLQKRVLRLDERTPG